MQLMSITLFSNSKRLFRVKTMSQRNVFFSTLGENKTKYNFKTTFDTKNNILIKTDFDFNSI